MGTSNTLLASFLLLFILSLSSSCEQQADQMKEYGENQTPAENQNDAQPRVDRKLIKESDIAFQTENVDQARNQVEKAVAQFKGYISKEKSYGEKGRRSHEMTLRIPSQHFDHFLQQATKGVDHFDRKEVRVKDVTEEFIDLGARIKTKKALEARFLELIQKAKNVKETMSIEREIEAVRSEIESMEGRLNYLKNAVSYSTFNLRFYEHTMRNPGVKHDFGKSFKQGWHNLLSFIVAITYLWPFFVLLVLSILGFKWYRKRNKSKS